MFVYRLFLFFFFLESRQRRCFVGTFCLLVVQLSTTTKFFFCCCLFLWCISFHSHHSRGAFKEKSCPRTLSSTLARPFHQNWFGRLWWKRLTWQKPYEVQSTSKTCLIRKSLKKYIQLRLLGVHIPDILRLVFNASFPPDICLDPTILKKLTGQDAAILKFFCLFLYLYVQHHFFSVRYQLSPCFLHICCQLGGLSKQICRNLGLKIWV